MRSSLTEKLYNIMPGLSLIHSYKKEWLASDLAAGLSVAAIAVPIGIAYSGLAGLPPETGLYASILPMIAYALFGSSRQLMVGPDSATCILIASTIAPLAVIGSKEYLSYSILLAIIVGVLCVAGGILKLGFISNFLSKPILTGYINGLAISIITGQLGKFFGFNVISGGFFKMMIDFLSKINETQILTLTIGLITFVFLRILKKYFSRIPAPLIAVVGGIIATLMFDLDGKGLAVVGHVPAGFPALFIPEVDSGKLEMLLTGSLGIVLISYCSGMLTNKSFASRNGYKIDANKDFIALGVANIFSGLSQGYVISGADSRTAVNNSSGGKTQLVSVVAAISVAFVVMFFTHYFEYLPITTLSAIIISATFGLFNIDYLRKLYRVSRNEYYLALFTALSVITIGVLHAVLLAVLITLIRLLAKSSKPHDEILGLDESTNRYHNLIECPDAKEIPGILIYRFESSLVFYNADYFKTRILEVLSQRKDNIKYLILDASSINHIDITASDTLEELTNELSKEGIEILFVKLMNEEHSMLERSGVLEKIGNNKLFDSIRLAVDYCNGKEKSVKK